MFTGIVAEVGSIVSIQAGKLTIAASQVIKEIKSGGSIAVNGVCLTVTAFDNRSFSVDIMPETLKRTNLGRLHAGDRVNLERPLGLGREIGGHMVQGHIDDTGKIASITREGEAVLMRFEAKPEVMRYIVPKGFIAVDGTSLTVTTRDANSFSVSIVGYTRQHTILADKKPGNTVNLEVDIIGKYVAEFNKPQTTDMTTAFLQEHGFLIT